MPHESQSVIRKPPLGWHTTTLLHQLLMAFATQRSQHTELCRKSCSFAVRYWKACWRLFCLTCNVPKSDTEETQGNNVLLLGVQWDEMSCERALVTRRRQWRCQFHWRLQLLHASTASGDGADAWCRRTQRIHSSRRHHVESEWVRVESTATRLSPARLVSATTSIARSVITVICRVIWFLS